MGLRRRLRRLEDATASSVGATPPRGPTTLDQIRALERHIQHIEEGMSEEELRAERTELEEFFASVERHPLDEKIKAIADEIARLEELDAKGS